VLARHHNANRTLDVYVFDHVKASTPTRIFLLQGLMMPSRIVVLPHFPC
jgi:hypothetical protein